LKAGQIVHIKIGQQRNWLLAESMSI